MSIDLISHTTNWNYGSGAQEPPPTGRSGPPMPSWAIGAGIAGALALTLAAFVIWKVLFTSCTDLRQERGQIEDYLAKGQTSVAIALIETALSQEKPPPCGPTKSALVKAWY